jgi:hypothetical protein
MNGHDLEAYLRAIKADNRAEKKRKLEEQADAEVAPPAMTEPFAPLAFARQMMGTVQESSAAHAAVSAPAVAADAVPNEATMAVVEQMEGDAAESEVELQAEVIGQANEEAAVTFEVAVEAVAAVGVAEVAATELDDTEVDDDDDDDAAEGSDAVPPTDEPQLILYTVSKQKDGKRAVMHVFDAKNDLATLSSRVVKRVKWVSDNVPNSIIGKEFGGANRACCALRAALDPSKQALGNNGINFKVFLCVGADGKAVTIKEVLDKKQLAKYLK